MKFLYLEDYLSFILRLVMTLSVFKKVTDCFLIDSSHISMELLI